MAKAHAECKCRVCGKDFVIERSYGSRADADHFEAYAADYDEDAENAQQAAASREEEGE